MIEGSTTSGAIAKTGIGTGTDLGIDTGIEIMSETRSDAAKGTVSEGIGVTSLVQEEIVDMVTVNVTEKIEIKDGKGPMMVKIPVTFETMKAVRKGRDQMVMLLMIFLRRTSPPEIVLVLPKRTTLWIVGMETSSTMIREKRPMNLHPTRGTGIPLV